jgi:hypothetical protein
VQERKGRGLTVEEVQEVVRHGAAQFPRDRCAARPDGFNSAQVEPVTRLEIQICRGGGARGLFHPVCLDPGHAGEAPAVSLPSSPQRMYFAPENMRLLPA